MIPRRLLWGFSAPSLSRSFSSSVTRYSPKPLNTEGRHPGFARRAPRRGPAQPPNDGVTGGKPNQNSVVSNALATHDSGLLSTVHVPEDQHGILKSGHPSTSILANSAIVIQRQLELMNVMMGFEQANKYVIMDGQGNRIGYLAEQEHGLGRTVARQAFGTHRSFTTHVFDRNEMEVLRFHRPFSWISSSIRIYDATSPTDPTYQTSSALVGTGSGSIANSTAAHVSSRPHSDMRIIGEAQQEWAPLRRKYNLFLHRDISKDPSDPSAPRLTAGDLPLSDSKALQVAEAGKEEVGFAQFAYVNEPFLSWDFSLKSSDDRLIGSVNRNFAGFPREIFTDTGVYALRMDSAGLAAEPNHLISQTANTAPQSEVTGMTLDQRAIMLATAVSIDFDYFSRHSGAASGGGWFPIWFPMGGGTTEEAGAAGGAVEGAGNAGEGALGEGAKVGGATGAGTMAGYEAMQRAQDPDSPQNPGAEDSYWSQFDDASQRSPTQSGDSNPGWGSDDGTGGSVGGSGGGGGGLSDAFDDLF